MSAEALRRSSTQRSRSVFVAAGQGGSGHYLPIKQQTDSDTIDLTTSNVDDALCAHVADEVERCGAS